MIPIKDGRKILIFGKEINFIVKTKETKENIPIRKR